MVRRIYADTSAIGGYFDEEFQMFSRLLYERFRAGLDTLVVSNITLAELEGAPIAVQELLRRLPAGVLEEVAFDQAAARLADEYLEAGVISPKNREDARHIATATVHSVDVLVSWNFRHIVNLDRITGYNSVNRRNGYNQLEIRSPAEILRYGNDNEARDQDL